MASKFTISVFLLFLTFSFRSCYPQETWIRAAYWDSASQLPISDINSALFTHLLCAFSLINSSTYELFINPSNERYFSAFTNTVKTKNPSVVSLLSIWGGGNDPSIFSSMINETSRRRSFIESSISTARLYGFDGLDLAGVYPNSTINMTNLGYLLNEWKDAVNFDARNSSKSQLILVMASYYMPAQGSVVYPIESIRSNLDWIHIIAYDYYTPTKDNVTGVHAALYGASKWINTDSAIKEWIRRGLPTNKLVLGLPYHGYAWNLVNSNDNDVGALSSGPAVTIDGSMGYKQIKSFIQNYGYGAAETYNSTFVTNIFVVGSTWINFDDVEAIKVKISYARENKLLGYNCFQLGNDNDWVLSRAAYGGDEERRILVPILLAVAIVSLLLGTIICCCFKRKLIKSGIIGIFKRSLSWLKIKPRFVGDSNNDDPNLQSYSFSTIKAATHNFSYENKLGEGGYGPVYKGELPNGKEVAVKRLSKTSNQGEEEFQNEVTLTARLQHVNLVRVLGFCMEREEKMLIYEYMPNKSLDFYLHDPVRRYVLDWRKRVHIIEGITQGLLYLQQYSNYTIIHRDIKASNILLDGEMNAKIADFGMARLFKKDEPEANTGRIVGTYGYVPPEYVRKGIYSMKYDVYSFGVLLLQIISGKRTTCYYGPDENLNLLEYAYDLWENDEGREFIDSSLDDSSSACKVMRCLQVALLCVQENPLARPSILEVFVLLKNDAAPIATPKRPAFSTKRDVDSSPMTKIYSVNDATITQLVPR